MIPKPIFQFLSLLVVLALGVGAPAYAYLGHPPFAWVADVCDSRVLASIVGLLAGLVAALVVIVLLRTISDMRPLAEEIDGLRSISLADVRRESTKLQAMKNGTPAERRRYQLRMAAGSFGCLLVGATVLAANVEVGGRVFVLPIAMLIYGVFGPPIHLALAWHHGRRAERDSARVSPPE